MWTWWMRMTDEFKPSPSMQNRMARLHFLRDIWYGVANFEEVCNILFSGEKRCIIINSATHNITSSYNKKDTHIVPGCFVGYDEEVWNVIMYPLRIDGTMSFYRVFFLLYFSYCASIFFCRWYHSWTNENKLHGVGSWIAVSCGVWNSVLKDSKRKSLSFFSPVGCSDPTDPHIKYLLKSGRGRKTTFWQAASEIKASNIGSFVLSGWHRESRGSDERASPGTSVFNISKAPASTYLTSSRGPTQLPPEPFRKTNNKNHLHKACCWHRLGFHAKRNHIRVKIDLRVFLLSSHP